MKITEVAKVVSGPNPHRVDARKIYDSAHAVAARVPHRWMNEGKALFRVLVVKVPKPMEETKLL